MKKLRLVIICLLNDFGSLLRCWKMATNKAPVTPKTAPDAPTATVVWEAK